MTDSSLCQIQILSLEKTTKHVDEGRFPAKLSASWYPHETQPTRPDWLITHLSMFLIGYTAAATATTGTWTTATAAAKMPTATAPTSPPQLMPLAATTATTMAEWRQQKSQPQQHQHLQKPKAAPTPSSPFRRPDFRAAKEPQAQCPWRRRQMPCWLVDIHSMQGFHDYTPSSKIEPL